MIERTPIDMYMTARHEAAHVVVARHYGIGVEKATIVPTPGTDISGHVEFDLSTKDDPHDRANLITVNFAGGVAHRLMCPRRDACDIFCDGSEQDRERIDKLYDEKTHHFTRASRHRIAEDLVRRYRAEIEVLAGELMCRTMTLTGKEVDELLPGFGQCRCIVCQRGLREKGKMVWRVHKDDVMAAVRTEWDGATILPIGKAPWDRWQLDKKTVTKGPMYYGIYVDDEWKGWVVDRGPGGAQDYRDTRFVPDLVLSGQMERAVLVETGETDTDDGKRLWIEHTIRQEIKRPGDRGKNGER